MSTNERSLSYLYQNLDETNDEIQELFDRHGLDPILRDDYQGGNADIQDMLADCDKSIAFEMLTLLADVYQTVTQIINCQGEKYGERLAP